MSKASSPDELLRSIHGVSDKIVAVMRGGKVPGPPPKDAVDRRYARSVALQKLRRARSELQSELPPLRLVVDNTGGHA